jgi:hypothetical protein
VNLVGYYYRDDHNNVVIVNLVEDVLYSSGFQMSVPSCQRQFKKLLEFKNCSQITNLLNRW